MRILKKNLLTYSLIIICYSIGFAKEQNIANNKNEILDTLESIYLDHSPYSTIDTVEANKRLNKVKIEILGASIKDDTLIFLYDIVRSNYLMCIGRIDSTKSILSSYKEDFICNMEEKSPVWLNRYKSLLGISCSKLWQEEDGINYLEEAYNFFLGKTYEHDLLRVLLYYSQCTSGVNSVRGLDRATNLSGHAFALSKKLEDKRAYLFAQIQITRYESCRKNYTNALSICLYVVEKAEQENYVEILKIAYINIIKIYNENKENDKVKLIAEKMKALPFDQQNQFDQRYLFILYSDLADMYKSMYSLKLSEEYCILSHEYAKATNILRAEVLSLDKLGRILKDQNFFSRSMEYFYQALEKSIILGDNVWTSQICLEMLNLINDTNISLEESRVDTTILNSYIQRIVEDDEYNDIHLYNYYIQRQDYKSATYCINRYIHTQDSIRIHANKIALFITEEKIRAEKEAEVASIELLTKATQIKNDRLAFILILFIISLCFFIGIIGWSTYQKQLRLKAVNTLRQKLSSDLHDDIGSTLSHLNHLVRNLKTTDTGNFNNDLNLITRKSDYVINTMSDIIWSINTKKDKIGDLVLKMEEHLQSYQTNVIPDYLFEYDNVDILMELSVEDKYNLFHRC